MKKRRLDRVRLDYHPHPFRFYRPTRLAKLFDVDVSTIWRWEKDGILPPAVQIGPGVRGWTEDRLKKLLDERRREAEGATDAR